MKEESMSKPKIDWTKPLDELSRTLKTRDGSAVQIYAVSAKGEQPIHGAVLDDGIVAQWDIDGRYDENGESRLDLIQEPERFTVPLSGGWFAIFRLGTEGGIEGKIVSRGVYPTKEKALEAAGPFGGTLVACIEAPALTGFVGEGLEQEA